MKVTQMRLYNLVGYEKKWRFSPNYGRERMLDAFDGETKHGLDYPNS
jgi:hypothetical protein